MILDDQLDSARLRRKTHAQPTLIQDMPAAIQTCLHQGEQHTIAGRPEQEPMIDHDRTPRRIPRALLSVSDKTGLIEFARALAGHGVELVSTGGTAQRSPTPA